MTFNPDDVVVRVKHIRALNLCMKGCRAWFSAVGLDWNDFVLNGATVAKLRATGDAMPERVIAVAIAEAEAKHGQ